jgi:transposase
MPPSYVKPYVKRGKTDAGDAEAICEAVTRPTMRFVAIKSAEQQSILALHRTRGLLIRQRTQSVNMIRAQLAEFGIVVAKGIQHALKLVDQVLAGTVPDIPALAREVVLALAGHLRDLQARIAGFDKALVASVADPGQFTSSRQFAAWLGLTPRAESSGGKQRMGRISKMGDRYLSRLLVNGMTAQLRWARQRPDAFPWVTALLHRRPAKLVAVAMANKTARIAWAVMVRGQTYCAPRPATQATAMAATVDAA